MKLSFLLNEENILTGVRGGDRPVRDLLNDLLTPLYEQASLQDEGLDKEELLSALLAREREMTTGLGGGIAFPHIRLETLSKSRTLLGICPEGTPFNSMDHQPVQFFVLSIVPQSQANLLLLNRAAIVRFLASPENRRAALAATDSLEVWRQIDRSGVSMDRNILAADIMRPQRGFVRTGATLREAARALHKYHSDSLPILDENNRFAGDISCYDLFSYGLPDFFANLKTISFVRNMDPFEKYFQTGRDLRLCDLNLTRESPLIAADATLMEIVFEIAVRNKPLLYVVNAEKKLLGVIDRFSIVDKILVSA